MIQLCVTYAFAVNNIDANNNDVCLWQYKQNNNNKYIIFTAAQLQIIIIIIALVELNVIWKCVLFDAW